MTAWKYTTVGEAFVTATGTTPPKADTKLYGKHMPFVKPPELVDGPLSLSEDNLSVLGAEVARVLPPRSVLVSCIGNLGKIGINLVPVAFNQQINGILPNLKVALPEFMFYQALSGGFRSQLKERRSGTTIALVNKSKFNTIKIVLPPLPEQQRIVSILDEAFEGIAKARANAEKNLANARELFESELAQIFRQSGGSWAPGSLLNFVGDISTGPFGSMLHKSDYVIGGLPLVNPINIQQDKIVPDSRKAIGKATAVRLKRYVLGVNDVVIARRGEIGRCAVVVQDQAGWMCGTGCFFIKPSGKIDPTFLVHLLRSQPYRSKLEGVSDRATMSSISNTDLAKLEVHIPPLAEQKRILTTIDGLSDSTYQLRDIYEKKLGMLEDLKRSVLDQAFTGHL